MMIIKPSVYYAPVLRFILRSLGYLYPLCSGCGTIANTPLFSSSVPSKPVLVFLKNGYQLWIEPNDYIGKSIYYFREFDPKVTFICRKLLEKGDIFLDIGANLGLVSLSCADILQSEGEIHAFEPNPQVLELLNKSVEANQMNNIFIHPIGLSDRDGTAEMYLCSENLGRASLSTKVSSQKIEINIRDSAHILAEIFDKNPAPYLLKIDVEGHEFVILKRLKNILAARKPKAILFEFNKHIENSEERSIFKLLREIGMVIYSIPRALTTPYLKPLPENFDIPPTNDYLAVDESQIDWLKARLRIR